MRGGKAIQLFILFQLLIMWFVECNWQGNQQETDAYTLWWILFYADM
jgi:hypothetical protein